MADFTPNGHPIKSSPQRELREGQKVTWLGLWLSLLLIILKAAAGHWGHSRALMADAIHSASDLVSDLLVLLGFKMSRTPADENHPWGHGKLETLTSALVGILLAAAGVMIAYGAVEQLFDGPGQRPRLWAVLMALISVVTKEALYRYTMTIARRLQSPLLQANAWHHRSDALSSLAVLAGVAGTAIGPGWWVLDPIAALAVSTMILKTSGQVMLEALRELMDASPEGSVLQGVLDCACSTKGVLGVHDLRVRSMAGRLFVEIHVEVDGDLTVRQGHSIAKKVELKLHGSLPRVSQVIVHVDPQ